VKSDLSATLATASEAHRLMSQVMDDQGNLLCEEMKSTNEQSLGLIECAHRLARAINQTSSFSSRRVKFHALCLLLADQVQTLDAIRVLTVNGRSSHARALCRRMYEGFLAVLAISFYHGPWPSRRNRRQGVQTEVTGDYLARRFMGFVDFQLDQAIPEDMEPPFVNNAINTQHTTELRKRRKRLSERAKRASRKFGFDASSHTWHGLSTRQLCDLLWPLGRAPCFPPGLVGDDDRGSWDRMCRCLYRWTSRHVHCDPYALAMDTAPRSGDTGIIDTSRDSHPSILSSANTLFLVATRAIAHGMDRINEFEKAFQFAVSDDPHE
jgi:hypothetical protein